MGNELVLAEHRAGWGTRVRNAWLALRSESTQVVGLDRPDERRVISPSTGGRWWGGSEKTRDEAVDADVSTVNSILRDADGGRTSRFIDLCDSTRTRDSRLDAVGRTRVLAVQGRTWVMRPPPGYEMDAEAKRVAKAVTQWFNETRDLETLFGHLAHAALYGHACLEHQWYRVGDEWRTQPRWIHGNRFAWNVADERVGFTRGAGASVKDGDYLDQFVDKFVFHNPVAGRSAYPWQRGAMRSRVLASVIKRLGVRFWVKMLERWGQPQVYVVKPAPASASGTGETAAGDEDARILEMLRGRGDTWSGIVPYGAKIETIPANVISDLHERWVTYQNIEDAIAILGQNLSTEISMGGSYAAAKAHALVRLDVLAADLAELTSTVTDQWIRALVFYNFGASVPVPYIDWYMQPKSAWTVADFEAGLCSADEFRNSNGHDAEADGGGGRYATGAKVEAPKALPTTTEPTTAAADTAKVADTALNGAQIDALAGLLEKVGLGTLPKESATAFITAAFPTIDIAKAKSMVDPIVVAAAPPSP